MCFGAGAAALDPVTHRYSATLPCLAAERSTCGPDHRIQVRNGDGLHLSNLNGSLGPAEPCPVYSSGVRRFGDTVARAVQRLLAADGRSHRP